MIGEIIALIIIVLLFGYVPYQFIKSIYESYLVKTGRSKGQRELVESWRKFDNKQLRQNTVNRIRKEKELAKAERLINRNKLEEAIDIYDMYGSQKLKESTLKKQAYIREEALDFDSAILIWEELGEIKEAARVRKKQVEQSSVKVDQTVVQGDYVDDRDTIVKDSVVNRSNVGAGGKTKGERIKLIKELLDSGAIDDDEFKQMKKEILGK
jgi:hypothetical protein